jgi:hypothetical protein
VSWLGERWELREGDELIGVITIEEQDFPWLHGSFDAEAGFARWAPLFDAEQRLAEELSDRDDPEGWERWEQLYDRISRALTLVAPNEPVAEYLLHIEDGEARFRWSNEAFED